MLIPATHRAVLIIAVAATGPLSCSKDPDPAWSRLGAMPIERRLQLSANLGRFDALPPEDQAAIREIDAALDHADPAIRGRYRAILRKYRAWAAGLDPAKRAELDRARTPDAKLALVAAWRKGEVAPSELARTRLGIGVYPGDLGSIPPIVLGNALRVWLALDDKSRAQVEAIDQILPRIADLIRIGRQKGIAMDHFPAAAESKLLDQLEANERVRAVFTMYFRRQEQAEAKGDPARPKSGNRPPASAQPLRHLAESIYFSEHPPVPVGLANLVRFEAALPFWLRNSFDPLPPEDARRRLSILYRQIYPHPSEMPVDRAAPKASNVPIPAPKAKTKAAPASPF